MIDPPALLVRKIRALVATVEPSSPASLTETVGEGWNAEENVDLKKSDANDTQRPFQPRNAGDSYNGIYHAAVRRWAKREGIPVRDRGRLTRSLIDKYREALGRGDTN